MDIVSEWNSSCQYNTTTTELSNNTSSPHRNNIIATTVETPAAAPDPSNVPIVVSRDPRLRNVQQPQPNTQQHTNLTTQRHEQQQQPDDPYQPSISTLTKRLREPPNPQTYASMMLKPKDSTRADLLNHLLTTDTSLPSNPAPIASALSKLQGAESYDRHAAESKTYFLKKTAGYSSATLPTPPVQTIGGSGHGGGYFGNSVRGATAYAGAASSPMEGVERTANMPSLAGAAPVAPMAPSMSMGGASGGGPRRSSAGEGMASGGLGVSVIDASRDPRRKNIDASRDPRRR